MAVEAGTEGGGGGASVSILDGAVSCDAASAPASSVVEGTTTGMTPSGNNPTNSLTSSLLANRTLSVSNSALRDSFSDRTVLSIEASWEGGVGVCVCVRVVDEGGGGCEGEGMGWEGDAEEEGRGERAGGDIRGREVEGGVVVVEGPA